MGAEGKNVLSEKGRGIPFCTEELWCQLCVTAATFGENAAVGDVSELKPSEQEGSAQGETP